MIKFDITNKEQVDRQLKQLIKALKKPKAALQDAAIMMQRDVLDHFRNEAGPHGRWKRSKRAKAQNGLTLQDRGILRLSITHRSAARATDRDAIVGTNVRYAKTHNNGYSGKNIPKRQFLWLSTSATSRIIKMFKSYVEGAV